MIRAVHCIYDHPKNPWVGGGGAVRLVEIYRRLREEVDVTLVVGRFPGSVGAPADLRFQFLGMSRPYSLSRLTYGIAASRLLARADYDCAVFDFSAYTPILVPQKRPVGLMLGQLASHTAMRRWGSMGSRIVEGWERRQLRSVRHVSAVSSWLLQQASPWLRADAEGCVVGAGVDDAFFSVRREDRGYLLYFGRFDVFQKGIDVVIDAFAEVSRRRPGARLILAGRGRDHERIVRMVHERGLGPAVEVIRDPSPERTRELLAGATLLTMPSRFEGFGMVAAEAMAAGVPVVAAAVDAVPDVVGPDAARLVPPEDPHALAVAIGELIDSPAERERLSMAGRERARRYRWDAVAADHLNWLRRIIADHDGPHR